MRTVINTVECLGEVDENSYSTERFRGTGASFNFVSTIESTRHKIGEVGNLINGASMWTKTTLILGELWFDDVLKSISHDVFNKLSYNRGAYHDNYQDWAMISKYEAPLCWF